MRAADVQVGVEYACYSGSKYTYAVRRVRVDALERPLPHLPVEVQVTFLDTQTGKVLRHEKDAPSSAYRSYPGHKAGDPRTGWVPCREIRTLWAAHLVDLEQTRQARRAEAARKDALAAELTARAQSLKDRCEAQHVPVPNGLHDPELYGKRNCDESHPRVSVTLEWLESVLSKGEPS